MLFPGLCAGASSELYDLVYIWDSDLDSVLDYKDELEKLLGPEKGSRLKIVGRGEEYGVIYDCNSTALDVVQLIVEHGEALREAGMDQAYAIPDQGYHELYNVSYGYGPNLEALKREYSRIYTYLGHAVGKDLFIEQADGDNYMLVYRRRGDRASTSTVARRHAKLLRKKGIKTTITPERNAPVVHGESSHLDDSETEAVAAAEPAAPAAVAEERTEKNQAEQPTQPDPPTGGIVVLKPLGKKKPVSSAAKEIAAAPVPVKLDELTARKDLDFEQRVERYIKELRQQGKLRSDEMTGWMVYDLTRDVSLVDINSNQAFQAASMIKPFVALAFFHKVRAGQLHYGSQSRQKMEAMIQRSSNSATNWVMRQVGGPASCQALLKKAYPHLFRNTSIVEYIPAGGRTYRNRAQPSDYIRFLRALWNNELPYGKEMRRLMSLPGRDRLYHGTPIPQGTLVYNKTGTTAHLCGDMGILAPRAKDGRRYPYAIVGVIERDSRPTNYKQWMATRGGVIRQVSTIVYKELKKQYKLL